LAGRLIWPCNLRNEDTGRWHRGGDKATIGQVTTALRVNATSDNGENLVLPDARFVTFRVKGNGSVTGGAVTIGR
jgi:hypothetical protein